MSHRIYNFSAGPAILPEPVLEEAAAGVRELNGSGMSILEVSHRGKDYEAIHADAEAACCASWDWTPPSMRPSFCRAGPACNSPCCRRTF